MSSTSTPRPPYPLTNAQARAFLLRKQGLLGAPRFQGPEGVCAFVRQAGCVQFDPIDVCGKNAELVFQSRIPDFTKSMLDRLLYEDRRLVDAFDKNLSLYCVEDWSSFARFRRRYGHEGWHRERIEAVSQIVHAALDGKDFITARDVPLDGKIDWGWGPTSLARAALETLYFRGELVIHHKRGSIKYYAPVERHLPLALLAAPDPNPDDFEFVKWMVLRRIGSVGMLWNHPSDAWLMLPGFKSAHREAVFAALLAEGRVVPCRVEGIEDPLYVLASDEPLMRRVLAGDGGGGERAGDGTKRLELLAPLDNLLWDRKLVRALFEFDYKWEIYTPVIQRRYGYYVLPVLYGDRLVGRVEPVVDKGTKRLKVARFWPEPDFEPDADFEAAWHERLKRFAAFNGGTYWKSKMARRALG
jgi:uncharacterized protein YcaQ